MLQALMLILLSFSCLAQNTYSFEFHFVKNAVLIEKVMIREDGASYDDAFERASKKCFDALRTKYGRDYSLSMDFIDTCVNPRPWGGKK